MLDGLVQAFTGFKAKRLLKKASSILAKLNYEVVDTDKSTGTLAFKFDEGSVALFVVDQTTLGHRIEATVLFGAEILNLKLMSDIATLAYQHRCSISGAIPTGNQKTKFELSYSFGEKGFSRRDVAVGLTYVAQCLKQIGERLLGKAAAVNTFKFDLTMFDEPEIPFFDPQLVAERKEFRYGDWDNYVQAVANQQALGAYHADVEHPLDLVLACRDFEVVNNVSLAEVGECVMSELARHRNFKAAPPDPKKVH